MDFVEFYVAVNPPLSPSGVAEVRERLDTVELAHEDCVVEMIYDPDVPWFKFLVNSCLRGTICNLMETTLAEIGQNDANMGDKDEDSSSHADIETTENSRLVNWPTEETNTPDHHRYTPYRFPKFAVNGGPEPPFKAAWHGVEENWSIKNKEQFFGGNTLPQQFNTEVTWNLKSSVLYIASYESMENVEKTIKALDEMVETEKDRYQTQSKIEERERETVDKDYVEPEEFW